MPSPNEQITTSDGFEEFYGQDFKIPGIGYNRNTHPIWEYNAGGHGKPNWRRYPARIEGKIESMIRSNCLLYAYRPGDPNCDNNLETPPILREKVQPGEFDHSFHHTLLIRPGHPAEMISE